VEIMTVKHLTSVINKWQTDGDLNAKVIRIPDTGPLESEAPTPPVPPAPVTVPPHNELEGLQGGSTEERYHLTAKQVGYVQPPTPPDEPVTVEDTDTVDMSITGQQISAETIGLTATITFVEGY
jgi:hypothetical protein